MPAKTAKKPVKKPASKAAAKPVAKKAKPAPKKAPVKAAKVAPKPAKAAKPVAAKAPAAKPAPKPVAKPAPRAPERPASRGVVATARPRSGSDSLEFKGFTPYQERRGEEYMGPKQSEHFRNILDAWKRELMEKVDETVHHMQDEAANFPDPNDRASQESDFTMELRARDRERKLIKKIDETIGKINEGDYGYCESCGVEIGIERLQARPTASLCIDCKTLEEIKEKQVAK